MLTVKERLCTITSPIATICAGLGLAFVLGAIANTPEAARPGRLSGRGRHRRAVHARLRGRSGAGAPQLAEIGVILLMFGVGLHFSVKDLMAVRKIAIPGAVVRDPGRHRHGHRPGPRAGLDPGAGIVFGLALSVASTVVLLRALQERRLIETDRGRIAVGWLIVEDLAMVLALVLLPALSGILGGEERACLAPAAWPAPTSP